MLLRVSLGNRIPGWLFNRKNKELWAVILCNQPGGLMNAGDGDENFSTRLFETVNAFYYFEPGKSCSDKYAICSHSPSTTHSVRMRVSTTGRVTKWIP